MDTGKKKILLVLPTYRIGGTSVCTLHLLELLKGQYEFSIMVLDNDGPLKDFFTEYETMPVGFLQDAYYLNCWRRKFIGFRKLLVALIRLIRNHIPVFDKWILDRILSDAQVNDRFDTVIACQEGDATYFASKISCGNRIAWVRCDYACYLEQNKGIKESFYSKINHIICVSEKTTEHFKDIYPEYADKTICVLDPHSSEFILRQSQMDDSDVRFRNDKFTIVSVGRIDPVKRFSAIPFIAEQIHKENPNFRWYIIGTGNSEELQKIEKAIELSSVKEQVILLGSKLNPNFYIKEADLYACTSSSEACPGVVNEAKILGTPVISTDYPSIYEFIENGKTGVITNIDEFSNAVLAIMEDKELYNTIKSNISSFKFNNEPLLKAIQNAIEL